MFRIEPAGKHRRERSGPEELKQPLDNWLGGLRSIAPAPESSSTRLQKLEQRGHEKMESIAHESDSPRRSDDEGRWQDDGGAGTGEQGR